MTVTVAADGCRGVELAPGDIDRAFADMRAAGCDIVNSEQIG
jgi:nicotinamidase/pyrazinamidase